MKDFFQRYSKTIALLGLALFPLAVPVLEALVTVGGSAEHFGLLYILLVPAALSTLAIGLYDCTFTKKLTFLPLSLVALNVLVPITYIKFYGVGVLFFVVAFGIGVVLKMLLDKFRVKVVYTIIHIMGFILVVLALVGAYIEVGKVVKSFTDIEYALDECSRYECFNSVANRFEPWNPNLCDQLRRIYKQECLSALAVGKDDIRVCYEFERRDPTNFRRDRCLRNFLGTKDDHSSICKQLPSQQQDSCDDASERVVDNIKQGGGIPVWH